MDQVTLNTAQNVNGAQCSLGQSRPNVDGTRPRIFLVSPANLAGQRGRLLLGPASGSERALRLRREGLPLGELFSFVSGLYFRGKIEYARAFAKAPAGSPGVFVITSCRGLLPPDTLITLADLREMTDVLIEPSDTWYRLPLERDARMISEVAGNECEIILLGSIATPKYVGPLAAVLGERLLFPSEFVGRGDMSRGGLLLRCVRGEFELSYVPVATAVRRGRRPPKLSGVAKAPPPPQATL